MIRSNALGAITGLTRDSFLDQSQPSSANLNFILFYLCDKVLSRFVVAVVGRFSEIEETRGRGDAAYPVALDRVSEFTMRFRVRYLMPERHPQTSPRQSAGAKPQSAALGR